MHELLRKVQLSYPQIRLVNLVAFVFIGVLIIPGMDSMRVIKDDTFDQGKNAFALASDQGPF